MLTQSLDFTRTLDDLVRLAVPRLADWCSIDLLEHGQVHNVGVANVDGATAELVRADLRDRAGDAQAATGAAWAIRTARSELMTEIPGALLEDGATAADLLRTLHRPRSRAVLVHHRAAQGTWPHARRSDPGRRRVGTSILPGRSHHRRGSRPARRARHRQLAALRGAARDCAHAPAEPAPGNARAAAWHGDRGALPGERGGSRGRGRLLRRLARRRRVRARDRRRRGQGPGRRRADRPDPPCDAGRVALRDLPHARAGGGERGDPRPRLGERVLHGCARVPAPHGRRLLADRRVRRPCAAVRAAGWRRQPSRRPASAARCSESTSGRSSTTTRPTSGSETSSHSGRMASPSAGMPACCSASSGSRSLIEQLEGRSADEVVAAHRRGRRRVRPRVPGRRRGDPRGARHGGRERNAGPAPSRFPPGTGSRRSRAVASGSLTCGSRSSSPA